MINWKKEIKDGSVWIIYFALIALIGALVSCETPRYYCDCSVQFDVSLDGQIYGPRYSTTLNKECNRVTERDLLNAAHTSYDFDAQIVSDREVCY